MLNFGGVFLFLTMFCLPSLQAAKYTETRIARNGKAAKQKGWLLKLHMVQSCAFKGLEPKSFLKVDVGNDFSSFFFKALTLDIDSRKKNTVFFFPQTVYCWGS